MDGHQSGHPAPVFPRAPHLSRAVLRPRCARARPAPGAPWSAMSNGLDAATRFPSSPLRGSPDPRADARLRRCHTSCEALPVVRTWLPRSAACAPAAPALPTRNRGRSCERSSPASSRPPRCSRNLLEAKFRANAPCGTPRGRGVLVSLSPAAVPGGPDTDHASKAVMVCASCPGALAPSMRHLHRAKRWRRLVAGSAAKRLPWCRAWRDFFESVTGSPQALSAAAAVTALRAVRRHPLRLRASRSGATGRPGSKSCGWRPHATPPTCHAIARRATADWRLSSPRAHLLFSSFRFRISARREAACGPDTP